MRAVRRRIIPLLLSLLLLAGCDLAYPAADPEAGMSSSVDLMAMDTFMRVTAYEKHGTLEDL